MADESSSSSACPVDHNARAAWLEAAARQKDSQQQQQRPSSPPPPHTSSSTLSASCGSSTMDPSPPISRPKLTNSRLSTERQVSTIPRGTTRESQSSAPPRPSAYTARPANSESETHTDPVSGNWIYPSEQMFFNAMRRKSYAPRTADMHTIIPIHNAVNERAWAEIKAWEAQSAPDSEKECGGPRLVSFAGDSTKLTPRARWNSLLGYTAPFDRHDWVVDRCGVRVEYVIDFYAGKPTGEAPSFYLDVRPKLNTWEGCRMRLGRAVGL